MYICIDIEWVTERLENSSSPILHLFHFGASIMGILNIAWIFGECATILGNSDPFGWNYFGRVDRIKSEMAIHHIPEGLCDEIKAYYDYMYMNNRHGATQLLCDPDMSHSLRKKISIHMHRGILLHCSFFKGASQKCLEMACERLTLEIHLPKTILISAGDSISTRAISQMYIIGRGALKVIQGKPHVNPDQDIVISELHSGECFGEIALLHPNKSRNSTVMSITIVEVYSLTDHDFKDLLIGFPAFADEMSRVSIERIKSLNKMAREKSGSVLIAIPETSFGSVTNSLQNGIDTKPTVEKQLEDLQNGITTIMHHIRAMNRRQL